MTQKQDTKRTLGFLGFSFDQLRYSANVVESADYTSISDLIAWCASTSEKVPQGLEAKLSSLNPEEATELFRRIAIYLDEPSTEARMIEAGLLVYQDV